MANAGRARQAGHAAVDALGVAAGVRMIWDHAVLARLDLARAPGGANDVYVAFGEMFQGRSDPIFDLTSNR